MPAAATSISGSLVMVYRAGIEAVRGAIDLQSLDVLHSRIAIDAKLDGGRDVRVAALQNWSDLDYFGRLRRRSVNHVNRPQDRAVRTRLHLEAEFSYGVEVMRVRSAVQVEVAELRFIKQHDYKHEEVNAIENVVNTTFKNKTFTYRGSFDDPLDLCSRSECISRNSPADP